MAKSRPKPKAKGKSSFKRRKGAWEDEREVPWADPLKRLDKSLNRGGGRG